MQLRFPFCTWHHGVTVLWHQTGLLLLFLLSGLSLVANEQEAESALRITSRMQRGLAGFEDAAAVRKQVFVVEQGFEEEFDEIDSLAWHVVLYDGDKPIATGRTFLRDGQFIIGRWQSAANTAVCMSERLSLRSWKKKSSSWAAPRHDCLHSSRRRAFMKNWDIILLQISIIMKSTVLILKW